MAKVIVPKKRIVISYNKLSEELQELMKEQFPNGITDHMIRIEKGPGDFFYAVVFETEEVNYLVKIDVEIDDSLEEEGEEEDKGYYEDEIKGADEIPDSDDDDEDM